VTIRPRTNAPPFNRLPWFDTVATTLTERSISSTAGLMNITRPSNAVPGTPSVENSSRCPARTADA
jgi:hypothetical protein